MSNAPVCIIDPVISNQQPEAKKLPSIPPATDLQSALAAINALTMAVNTLMNNVSGANNAQGGGFRVIDKNNNKPSAPARWQEVERVVQKVRVFNPQDNTQYVDVKQINRLIMKDSKTGEQWVWNRGSDNG